MKYFVIENGMENVKAAIKQQYKELVKKFHPDLHKDETKKYTKIMQQINEEFEEALSTVFSGSVFNSYTRKQNMQISDWVLRYFFKDRNRDAYIAYERYNKGIFYNDDSYIIAENGMITSPGLYFVKTGAVDYSEQRDKCYPAGYDYKVTECYKAEEVTPEDLARDLINIVEDPYDIAKYRYYSLYIYNIRGSLIVTTNMYDRRNTSTSCGNTMWMYAKDKLGNVQVCSIPAYLLKKATCTDTMQVADLLFYTDQWNDLGCYSMEEFRSMYDTDYVYASTSREPSMGYEKVGKDEFMVYTESASVMAMIRYGIIEIYRSRYKPQLMFGFIVEDKLFASKFGCDDVADAQDFLSELNDTFEERFRRMCRKGVIKIKV